jgi:hypothetical protein
MSRHGAKITTGVGGSAEATLEGSRRFQPHSRERLSRIEGAMATGPRLRVVQDEACLRQAQGPVMAYGSVAQFGEQPRHVGGGLGQQIDAVQVDLEFGGAAPDPPSLGEDLVQPPLGTFALGGDAQMAAPDPYGPMAGPAAGPPRSTTWTGTWPRARSALPPTDNWRASSAEGSRPVAGGVRRGPCRGNRRRA